MKKGLETSGADMATDTGKVGERPMKPIPVSAAAQIAKAYGYDQVIVIARRVGEAPNPFGEHVTTYGRGSTHCGVAARVGNYIKHKIMGWPEYSTLREHDMKAALEAAEKKIASCYIEASAVEQDETIALIRAALSRAEQVKS